MRGQSRRAHPGRHGQLAKDGSPMMKTLLFASLLLSLVGACATDDDQAIDSTQEAVTASGNGCAQVLIITARASTESPGEGTTASLVSAIVNASRQTVARASVSYPATLSNYASSSAQGVSALKSQLTAAVQNCPSQKIVLAGYSQGAHVILDVLGGGGGGSLGATTDPIAASIASHVVAAVSFGDPRHVTG